MGSKNQFRPTIHSGLLGHISAKNNIHVISEHIVKNHMMTCGRFGPGRISLHPGHSNPPWVTGPRWATQVQIPRLRRHLGSGGLPRPGCP